MKKRHSEEPIIRILRETEAHEVPIREVCRQHNVSEQTVYCWSEKYGGMEVADAFLHHAKRSYRACSLADQCRSEVSASSRG